MKPQQAFSLSLPLPLSLSLSGIVFQADSKVNTTQQKAAILNLNADISSYSENTVL